MCFLDSMVLVVIEEMCLIRPLNSGSKPLEYSPMSEFSIRDPPGFGLFGMHLYEVVAHVKC